MRRLAVNRRGFTLIELLIAMGIFSLLGAGLATAFQAGIQVKRRTHQLEEQATRVLPVLVDLQQSLRNGVLLAGHSLQGAEKTLTFPAQVVSWDEDGIGETSVWLLQYSQNELTGDIEKKVTGLDEQDPHDSVLGSGGVALKFFYLNPVVGEDGLMWEPQWQGESPPSAVKIVLESAPLVEGGDPVVWQRVVRLPIAPRAGRK